MAQQEFGKKVERYEDSVYNYKGEGDIMVTITLAEYRELVETKAKGDMRWSEEFHKRLDAEGKAKELQESLDKANAAVTSLTSKLVAGREPSEPQFFDMKEAEHADAED